MSDHFHIIIAGDLDKPRSFKISKKSLITVSAVAFLSLTILTCISLFTTSVYSYNKILSIQTNIAKKNEKKFKDINTELEQQLTLTKTQNEKTLQELENEKSLLLAQLELESSKKIAELEKINLQQEMTFKEERDQLLSTAISELNARSDFIEDVISNIGIKVKQNNSKSSQKNSGGPYISANNEIYDNLIVRTDTYLKTIQTLPLGKPVNGSISSWYGNRIDPINGKKAFHSGVDFRGRKGDPVFATADGKVVFAGKNGGFGNFIKINHGNGYKTSYGHLHNYHVKKGDRVTRGQIIGLVGNSGRSTGTHLHYEIHYKNKTVNPRKFMKVANLTCKFDSK